MTQITDNITSILATALCKCNIRREIRIKAGREEKKNRKRKK